MPLFSRKPSREATLQRIYSDAYQDSVQSILKESSFEFDASLDSWKHTLAGISAGMATLDGTPPKTGQEKSLLASILDIERQCHDRIRALESRSSSSKSNHHKGSKDRNQATASPYGTPISSSSNRTSSTANLASSVTRVAVGTKSSHSNAISSKSAPEITAKSSSSKTAKSNSVTSKPQDTNNANAPAPPPHRSNKPVASSTPILASMPKIKDMGYNLYKRRPNPEPKNSHGSSPSLSNDKDKSDKKEPAFKSAAEYAQASNSQSLPPPRHGMLQTLRKNTPLGSTSSKPRQAANKAATAVWMSGSSSANNSPTTSPHSSAEAIETKAHQDLVKKAALLSTSTSNKGKSYMKPPSTGNSSNSTAHSPRLSADFQGFDSSFADGPTSPTLSNNSADGSNSPPLGSAGSSHQASKHSSSGQSTGHQSSRPHGNGRVNSYHVTYTKVQAGSRSIYRPVVTKVEHGASRSSNGTQPPSRSRNHSPSSNDNRSGDGRVKVLADEDPSAEDAIHDDDGLDDWDKMARKKIKELRGVDENAALQILNEVVLKGDPVHWCDIAGLEKAKASLKETVVYPFLRPDLFSGLREPALGMLLFGPPGTGKTMLARAVATESKSTFFSISASSLTSKYMGESEKLVRALFQMAKALAPSIIFVDEIDSILTQRADSGEHEASRRIKNEFLVQWSDLQAAAAGNASADNVRRVLVLGATNLPWAIDEAARRRFVRRQYIPLPEDSTRRVHIEKLLGYQKHALGPEEIESLVQVTDGYSGSDITALAKDAAMGPLRSLGDALLTTSPDQVPPIQYEDFLESMRSIRPSVSTEGLRAFENWATLYGSSGA